MKKYTLLTLILMVSLKTFSCTCFPFSLKENISNSTVIFIGKVLKVDTIKTVPDYFIREKLFVEDSMNYWTFDYLVTFQISKVYKGKLIERIIKIKTGIEASSCGYNFDKNKQYLVYSKSENVNLIDEAQVKPKLTQKIIYATDRCTRTTHEVTKESRLLAAALNKNNF